MKNKILILIVWLIFCGCVYWEEVDFSKINTELDYVPWEVIVKYKNDDSVLYSKNLSNKSVRNLSVYQLNSNLEVKEELDDSVTLFEIKDNKSVEEVVESLEQDPNVEYAEPNYIRYLFYMEDFNSTDTYKWEQWGLDYISWVDAWNNYSWIINSQIKVWVIDNGVNYNHLDLSSSMWNFDNCFVDWKEITCEHWYDFFHNTPTPLPNADDHGTHVAWIIAAWLNNWYWVIWVNPYAKIVSLKVGRDTSLTSADEIRAIKFAKDNWIKIINASYGSRYSSQLEKQAIEEFWEAWWLFITAAWNWDSNNNWQNVEVNTIYPCAYDLDNIICVAALDTTWNLAYYSNYGVKSVDIAAPWSEIISTVVGWLSQQTIFSQDFEDCKTNLGFEWWSSWFCYRWKGSKVNYGYSFSESLTSPNVSIWSDVKDVYISFSMSCNNANVWIEYLKNGLLSGANIIGLVDADWYNYTFGIPLDYYGSDFAFKLDILDAGSSSICVIDDVEIYEDPYVFNDNNRYWKKSWTSMATPHVVWLASLIWTVNPKLSYLEVKNFILDNWDEKSYLTGKTVSWKLINVKKTLDAVVESIVPIPDNLFSSWDGKIKWDVVDGVVDYYYEVLDWDNVIVSGNIADTLVDTQLTWNYHWRVQWIDNDWNKSKFGDSYICERPVFETINLSGLECSIITWNFNVDDVCSDQYEIAIKTVDGEVTWLDSIMNGSWFLQKILYVENAFWEVITWNINYFWRDSKPTINNVSYKYMNTITSSSQKNIWNIVSLLWANDWECWGSSVTAISVSCSQWLALLSLNDLLITAPSNKQWSSDCLIIFSDDEWNYLTWDFNYSFNTVVSSNNNWWGWWGGWWWGWGGWGWSDSVKIKDAENNLSGTGIEVEKKTEEKSEEKVVELEKPIKLDLFNDSEQVHNSPDFDFSWFNNENPSLVLSNWYTVEFNNAYEFAYKAWITTMNSIEKANMNWNLTRIAMAKMLSNYAINVLWKTPNISDAPNFLDVDKNLNDNYWWAVTLSYQLWIMWIWITNFRPYDTVTRAEFATALSRMLYWTPDWIGNYYSTHLAKLYKEWIINNVNPNLTELRWYVMIMLMRSAKT